MGTTKKNKMAYDLSNKEEHRPWCYHALHRVSCIRGVGSNSLAPALLET